jgi:hypothetical protein
MRYFSKNIQISGKTERHVDLGLSGSPAPVMLSLRSILSPLNKALKRDEMVRFVQYDRCSGHPCFGQRSITS